MWHYSKDCLKPKPGSGGSKVIALFANLAQGECDRLVFLKRKVFKWDVLCLLDIVASNNFITRIFVERMELKLEEPIEVHFVDGGPHPTTLQVRDVPFQLGNWKGKVDLLVSTLGGMKCILGMEFITHNNVFIEGHNKLTRILTKNGIIWMKAHEVPNVGGSTIHLMLGKTLEKECMGGYGMLCVMHVLNEFETKEITNLVSFTKCVQWVLDEFPDVMPCRNLSLGLATKARAYKGANQEGSPGLTSHAHGSAKECEVMNPHTPKWSPILGVRVPMDYQIFRGQMQGSKTIGFNFLIHNWKSIEM